MYIIKKIYYNLPYNFWIIINSFLIKFMNPVIDDFIQKPYGANYKVTKKQRIKIFKKIQRIVNEIPSATSIETHLTLVKYLLDLPKKKLGVVCVTAGPGATNALPGLAEAFVASAPIMIISGQVETEHTTYNSKLPLRTYGTAEINIIPIVKPLTKYAKFLDNPNDVQYVLEKAYHAAISGRPGPVWIDVPMDIQYSIIDINKLRSYKPPDNKLTIQSNDLDFILKKINSAKKPLIVAGQGIRQGKAEDQFKEFLNNFKIPVLFSRLGQDLLPHNHSYVYGQAGLKGSKYCKKIMNSSDLVLSLGCRLAPQFVGLNFEAFDKAEIIMVDIDKAEIDKLGDSVDYSINSDVKLFLEEINNKSSDINFPSWDNWINYCDD